MAKNNDVVTIGVDSSSTNCGIALFINGELEETFNFKFKGTYTLDKLYEIAKKFEWLFKRFKPALVIIEEPINVRNARAAMALNQVAASIITQAWNEDATVNFIHNKTIKSVFHYKTKEEAIKLAINKFGAEPTITEHEADAVLLVEAYKEMYLPPQDLPF